MLVSLFLKISAVTYTTVCCTACARVLSLDRSRCACLPARAGPPATAAPALSATRRQRRKVDKCRVADKTQTNKPTNQQTNTHYSFIGIDALLICYFVVLRNVTDLPCVTCSKLDLHCACIVYYLLLYAHAVMRQWCPMHA